MDGRLRKFTGNKQGYHTRKTFVCKEFVGNELKTVLESDKQNDTQLLILWAIGPIITYRLTNFSKEAL